MIQTSIRLNHPPQSNCWIDESPINEWLVANVGQGESFRNHKIKPRPWYVAHHEDCLVYYFVQEKDAVMFSLRWL
jgi:hypothetical protein